MNLKWKCRDCDWVGFNYLRAKNPFDKSQEISGCPQCKGAETLDNACDEPGCSRTSSCGFPTPGGYRRTCHEHSKWRNE